MSTPVSLSVEPSRAGPIRSARQEGLGHLNAEFIPSQASNNALAQARTGYGHVSGLRKMPCSRHSSVSADAMPTGSLPVCISFLSRRGQRRHGSRASSVTPLL